MTHDKPDGIAAMSLEDLQLVLDWAAAEGWNPGLDDAAAFHAVDPGGFLMKRVNGKPAAAIAIVNHDPRFAFLGLYIAAPEFRGQGHGLDVWRAALARAGDRTIGLDGVPAQQANYERAGFRHAGKTVRFRGRVPGSRRARSRVVSEEDLPALVSRDLRIHGVERRAYITRWLRGTARRRSVIVEAAGDLCYATARECRDGIKIGPLIADDAETAWALLHGLASAQTVLIDVPDTATALTAILETAGFTPVFETARMYRGTAPEHRHPLYFAVATLELG